MPKKLIIIVVFVGLMLSMIFNVFEKQVTFAQKTEVLYLYKCLYDDDKDLKKHTATIISEHETIGYFTQITWGDYYHFCLKDDSGKEYGFFIAINKDIDWKVFDKFENKKSYIGKKVKVYWHKVELFIPEANMKRVIDVMVNLKIME